MSDLSKMEKRKLERALGMSSGYVLDFSNRTFEDFFIETVNIEIYDQKYDYASGSKANRMRAFWDVEPNYIVAKNGQKEKQREVFQNHTGGYQDLRQEGVLSGQNFRDSQRGRGGRRHNLYLL